MAGLPSCSAADAASHPRLLLDAGKLKALRAAIQVEGSVHKEMFAALRWRVDKDQVPLWEHAIMDLVRRWAHGRAFKAQGEALLYLLTEDPKYAQMAYRTLREIHEKAGPEVALPERGPGLGRATVSLGFAFAYDWCYPAWDAAQRVYIRERLQTALTAWGAFQHANLGDVRGSNWAGICRSGELLVLLALGEERSREARFKFLVDELRLHLKNGYDDLGVTQEGMGYCEYAGLYVIPAVMALRSVGCRDLDEEFDAHAWWKQVMYAGSFAVHRDQPERQDPKRNEGDDHPLRVDRSQQQIFLMSGVAGPTIFDEGWCSLILATVPKEHRPEYLWWYDRALGKDSARKLEYRYDWERAGVTFALLFYPLNVQARDPAGRLPRALSGHAGMTYFRNRWKDRNDILISMTGDAHHHGHAWDQPEALQLGLFAYDTLFIGGPNKHRDPPFYSTLLVDGLNHSADKDAGGHTGTREFFEASPRGGYLIAGGGRKYAALGVDDVKRHLSVYFPDQAERAVASTLDRIRSARKHTYAWQIRVGSHDDDWGLKVACGSESGRPTFLLTAPNEAYLKGWVLHPRDAKVTAANPLQAVTEGGDADVWIVWLVGQGRPPEARITGQGLAAEWQADGVTCRWDPNTERVAITAP